jgi:predicted metal-dependent phosphoesterase TrpH
MVVADLHVHTTNSDGQLTLSTVPAAAQRADVDTVAITDHDRIHPDLDEPVTTRDGVTIIHGIELRVEVDDDFRVDLLGYGLSETDRLTAVVDSLQRNRIERARKIVDSVETETGVELDVSFEPGVGRPHIARAIAESDAEYDYEGAFRHLIGDGCPCYVQRDIPSFAEGRDCLQEACAVVGLAHPLRYDDPERALELTADLDAVERYYPYGRDVDESMVEQAAEENDLLLTGGTDAHDDVLGRAGLDESDYQTFAARL